MREMTNEERAEAFKRLREELLALPGPKTSDKYDNGPTNLTQLYLRTDDLETRSAILYVMNFYNQQRLVKVFAEFAKVGIGATQVLDILRSEYKRVKGERNV